MFGLELNSVAIGGIIITCITVVFGYIKGWVTPLWNYFIGHYTTSITVKDNYHVYYFINLALATRLNHEVGRFNLISDNITLGYRTLSKEGKQAKLVPGYGLHYLWLNNKPVFVWLSQRHLQQKEEGKSYEENINLWMPFSKASDIKILVDEGVDICKEFEKETKTIRIFHANKDYWVCSSRISPRPIDSVVLPQSTKENLLDDIEEFFASKEWYNNHGIPYRRGYLFYGPPGNGKTSIISALGGHFKCNIYIISLSSCVSDEYLNSLLSEINSKAIILLEDIDKIKVTNKGEKSDKITGLSLSGVLNAIDGVVGGDNYILFMTANNPERLDPALIRPGRIDKKIQFNNPSVEQLQKFISKFYDCPIFNKVTSLAEKIHGRDFSMANAQGFLMEHKKDLDGALANIDNYSIVLEC